MRSSSCRIALVTIALLHPLRSLADPDSARQTPDSRRAADSSARSSAQDEIQFRLLSRADFLASHPPRETAGHPAGLNAVSCLRIGWRGLQVEFSARGGGLREAGVSASVRTPRFVALFDRRCSWWSPEPENPAYALLHEQVHFAISEHAARMLTEEMRSKGRVIRGYGPTRDAAVASLEENLRGVASQAKWAARREHDAFDFETLRDRSQSVQQRWVDRYEEKLGVGLSRER
jgi:hypothetical protein